MEAAFDLIYIINILNIDKCEIGVLYCGHMASETRDVIIRTLRANGRCTVKELAEAAGISPVSVRHHLSALQADSLIQSEEVRHGVGRPLHVYSLTEEAHELFPTRYFRLTNRLLEEIKENLSDDALEILLSNVAASMAATYANQLEGLPLEHRLRRLVELLDEEGFSAEVERHGSELMIRELSCPYFQIGMQHPEVCTIDQAFIAMALSLPVERVRCVLDGDAHCAFSVQMEENQTA